MQSQANKDAMNAFGDKKPARRNNNNSKKFAEAFKKPERKLSGFLLSDSRLDIRIYP